MRLSDMARAVGGKLAGEDLDVRGVGHDSRQVQAGQLFVAIPGALADGATFIPEALRRGAVAVCAANAVEGTPTIVVPDPRLALAGLASAFHGHPAREIRLIGITGSLGKTSTALLLEAVIGASGEKVGVIGSLGIRFGDTVIETGMTTPEAPALHGALRFMVAQGAGTALMEVTSHSILLGRVAGLEFSLGVLTNIVPYEHLEFHSTPEDYIRTKARFLGMLKPHAPLIVNLDDRTAREVAASLDRRVLGVTLRGRADAAAAAERVSMGAGGSEFSLRLMRPLPLLDGGELAPFTLPLSLPILGRQQVANAALAATAALVAGVPIETVSRSLAGAEPMHRRMQIIYDDGPVVLDDTVGNPESVHAVFEALRNIPHHRLRVAYAIRGSRGPEVNERNAAALAKAVSASDAMLVVTASVDAAGPRDRVEDEEAKLVLDTLKRSGIDFAYEPTLEGAIARTLENCARGDLVLLLGAQGMNGGAALVREALGPPASERG